MTFTASVTVDPTRRTLQGGCAHVVDINGLPVGQNHFYSREEAETIARFINTSGDDLKEIFEVIEEGEEWRLTPYPK